MKKFDKIIISFLIMYVISLIITNIYMEKKFKTEDDNTFRISLNRICKDIMEFENERGIAPENINELLDFKNINSYEYIFELDSAKVSENQIKALNNLIDNKGNPYQIFMTDNYVYKIVYSVNKTNNSIIFEINIIFIVMFIIVFAILIFVRQNIWLPFENISNMPYELAKGNLTMPLKENKHKYFGRFIWGMDMLRENIEENKKKELELQKEKKTLILSLSHDIKTPLNAISLYSKAISKNLYNDDEKRIQAARNINNKVDEIEKYMSKIIKASNEDFLVFEVNNSDVYSKEIIEFIKSYYSEKMEINNINFCVGKYKNCIIFADVERAVEVVQNVVENAMKYGDGGEILLNAEKEDDEYHIVIKNSGCLLPENELTHIFDSFYRGSNSDGENGSGLGLYICRSLMHLMDGEILAKIINYNDEKWLEVRLIFRVI